MVISFNRWLNDRRNVDNITKLILNIRIFKLPQSNRWLSSGKKKIFSSIKNSNNIDMSKSGKRKAIRQCYLCEQLLSADLQSMKLRLIIFKCFSAKNTTQHDLVNMFY